MKISVCIATYNGASFLAKTIPSILNQLKLEDEIIIVDDASSDDTLKILESFKDKRIKIFKNIQNQGISPSFFRALSLATGDIIFIADQDDIWLANKVSSSLQQFNNESIGLLIHDGFIIKNNQKIDYSIFEINKSGKGFWKNLRSDTYVGCCMAMTAEVKEKLLPQKQIKKVYYDHYLGLMAEIKKVETKFYSEKLIHYNRHSDTHTDIFRRRNLITIIKDRIKLLWMIFRN